MHPIQSQPGQSVTFTATVAVVSPATGAHTGLVTFKDGASTLLGSSTLSGISGTFSTAALALSNSVHHRGLRRRWQFQASASSTLTQTVSTDVAGTWVSGGGDDNNNCSQTAPCQTFAAAISKTAAGGEMNCLDKSDFGPVTITKSITIDCTVPSHP